MDEPTDSSERLELALAHLQDELNAADRETARNLGVGSADDLQILRTLAADGPQRVGSLARSRRSSKATVSARLDRLEKRGLISRERLVEDRRSVAATLTETGAAAAATSRAARIAAVRAAGRTPAPATLLALASAVAETGPTA